MAFWAIFNVYLLRTILSVTIVAMVKLSTDDNISNSSEVCKEVDVSNVTHAVATVIIIYMQYKKAFNFIKLRT